MTNDFDIWCLSWIAYLSFFVLVIPSTIESHARTLSLPFLDWPLLLAEVSSLCFLLLDLWLF